MYVQTYEASKCHGASAMSVPANTPPYTVKEGSRLCKSDVAKIDQRHCIDSFVLCKLLSRSRGSHATACNGQRHCIATATIVSCKVCASSEGNSIRQHKHFSYEICNQACYKTPTGSQNSWQSWCDKSALGAEGSEAGSCSWAR